MLILQLPVEHGVTLMKYTSRALAVKKFQVHSLWKKVCYPEFIQQINMSC